MCSWISAVRFHMASGFSFSYSLAPAYMLCTLSCDQSITIFAAHSWHMLYKAVFGKHCTTSTEHQLPPLASHTGDCCYFCVLILSLGSSFSKMPPKLVLSTTILCPEQLLTPCSRTTLDSRAGCTLHKRCLAEGTKRSLKFNLCPPALCLCCWICPGERGGCLFLTHLLREQVRALSPSFRAA